MGPSGWQTQSVIDLQAAGVLLVEDGNHGEYRPRSNEFTECGVAFIRAADMDGGSILFETAAKIDDNARARITKGIGAGGDVILSHKGTVGKVALAPLGSPPFVCSPQTTFWRTLNDRVLDRRYLHAFLRSPGFHEQLRTRSGETDMAPYVSLTSQRALLVTLPPIGVQRVIAGVIGSLDDKIELNRRMNETLEAMARALFKSWFVDFDPVRAKAEGRQPSGMDAETAKLFPSEFEQSELGEIPKGWRVAPLGDLVSVLETGGRPKGGVSGVYSGVPSVGAESIVRVGYFDFSKTRYVSEQFYENMNRGRVEDRDVLLYKDGGRPGEFEPHVSMFGDGFPFDRFAINEHVYRLRVADGLSQEFLYLSLTSDRMMEEMRVKGTGVAIPGLNSTAARSLVMLVPTPNLIRASSRTLEILFSRIFASAAESRTLEGIRDALLPRLLSGEIELNRSAEDHA